MAATQGKTLADLVQDLPPELFNDIYDLVVPPLTANVSIDQSYRPPVVTLLSKQLRTPLAAAYYAHTSFLADNMLTLIKWLISLTREHRGMISSLTLTVRFTMDRDGRRKDSTTEKWQQNGYNHAHQLHHRNLSSLGLRRAAFDSCWIRKPFDERMAKRNMRKARTIVTEWELSQVMLNDETLLERESQGRSALVEKRNTRYSPLSEEEDIARDPDQAAWEDVVKRAWIYLREGPALSEADRGRQRSYLEIDASYH